MTCCLPGTWQRSPNWSSFFKHIMRITQTYLAGPAGTASEGETYDFPRGRRLRIVHGDIVDHEVDAIVSSDTHHLTMNYGVSLAIRRAGSDDRKKRRCVRDGATR